MAQRARIYVEVAYAPAGEQVVVGVRVEQGARVSDAIQASGLLVRYPEIDITTASVGVFGQLTQLDAPLRDWDRVEIYRALVADARDARRERARERKAARGRNGLRS